MQAQCWICPKCYDDHSFLGPCTPWTPGEGLLLTDYWETPQEKFDSLHAEFRFTVDGCAEHHNRKMDRYWDERMDAFKQDWTKERIFMNPPYSQAAKWMDFAFYQWCRGANLVAVMNHSTDTDWWHRYVEREQPDGTMKQIASEIRRPRNRWHFKAPPGLKSSSPRYPQAVIFYDDRNRPELVDAPFSSGSEFAGWESANCDMCKKSAINNPKKVKYGEGPCELDNALGTACLGDGKITADQYQRLGFPSWTCPEFVKLNKA